MTNNGESSASKRLKSPIPMDITDNIKGLFLPYLALGFTVQQTDFKKPNKSGYQALRCGFYAALEGLSLSHSKETLWDTDENWQNMLQSEEYKKTVRTSESLLEDDEEDELVLQRWCDDSWSLDSEQLSYLLMVANQHHGTNFQLGMITEGFRGRIDPETKEYDDEYLLPTAIRVVHHGTTNAPVVWLFNDNATERDTSHGKRKSDTDVAPNHRFKALTINEKGAPSKLRVLQNWQVGEAVDFDIKTGVWILRREQPSPDDASETEARAGCFMRLADDQREAHDGFLVLQRTDGNSITVSEKDVEKIEVDEEAAKRLNKSTDVAASQRLIALPGTKQKNQNPDSELTKSTNSCRKQATKKGSKSSSSRNSSEQGDDHTEKEDDDDETNRAEKPKQSKKKKQLVVESLNQTLSFFRVLPPSKMCEEYDKRMDGTVDPVYGFLKEFSVKIGDIVLDRTKSDVHYGMRTCLVRDVLGHEGYVWERRVQRISDPPFGLRDGLFIVPKHKGGFSRAVKASLQALAEGLGLSNEGAKHELKKRIKKDLQADEIEDTKRYLKVYRAMSNIKASVDWPVDIEKGEVLIQDEVASVGDGDLMLRDFEGIEAQVEEENFELVTNCGWDLRFLAPVPLETDEGSGTSLFNPQTNTPDAADSDILYENEIETKVEGDDGANADAMELDEVREHRVSGHSRKRRHSALEDAGDSPSPYKLKLQKKNGRMSILRPPLKQKLPLVGWREKGEETAEEKSQSEEQAEELVESSGDDEDEGDEE